MVLRVRHPRLWIWIVLVLGVMAISGFAMKRSVSIRTSWRVLPYQSLRLSGPSEETTVLAYTLPAATPLDSARGYIESEHAVRLHIVSNTPWKLQAIAYDLAPAWHSRMQLRKHGDDYITLSDQPQIVAEGRNGVFEISIDYRLLAGPEGEFTQDPSTDVVFMMMSD